MNQANDKLLTRDELAARLGVSRSTILRLEDGGKLKPVFVSERCVRYSPDTVAKIVHGEVLA